MEIVVVKILQNQPHIKSSIVTDATYLFVRNITVNKYNNTGSPLITPPLIVLFHYSTIFK